MDIRYKAFLGCEADAVRRQEMARIAQSVAAGMAGGEQLKTFIANLELNRSRKDIIRDNREMLGIRIPEKEE